MELPLAKIKRIAKFDPDVKLVSHEGAAALALSCEMFIKLMAEHVYQQTRLGKRKTVQIRDFDACLQNTAAFSFLEGALETWTDVAGLPGASATSNRTTANEEQSDKANEDDDGGMADRSVEKDTEDPPSVMAEADTLIDEGNSKAERLQCLESGIADQAEQSDGYEATAM